MNKVRAGVLAIVLLTGAAAFAQSPPGPGGPDIERIALLLDLDDSQKTAVQEVLDEQREKMRATFEQNKSAGTRPSREEMEQLHEQMKEETSAKLQGVLTAEQIKKFEALMDRPPMRGPKED